MAGYDQTEATVEELLEQQHESIEELLEQQHQSTVELKSSFDSLNNFFDEMDSKMDLMMDTLRGLRNDIRTLTSPSENGSEFSTMDLQPDDTIGDAVTCDEQQVEASRCATAFEFTMKRQVDEDPHSPKTTENPVVEVFHDDEWLGLEENDGSFYVKTVVQNEAYKVLSEMSEPNLEEDLLGIEGTNAAHDMLDERPKLSPVDSDEDLYGNKDSLSSFPYILEIISDDDKSNWVSGLLINLSKFSTQDVSKGFSTSENKVKIEFEKWHGKGNNQELLNYSNMYGEFMVYNHLFVEMCYRYFDPGGHFLPQMDRDVLKIDDDFWLSGILTFVFDPGGCSRPHMGCGSLECNNEQEDCCWTANVAEFLIIEVPWIMCQEDDILQSMINICNGWYFDSYCPNNPNHPNTRIGNWTGRFKSWGGLEPLRIVGDVVFAIVKFEAASIDKAVRWLRYGCFWTIKQIRVIVIPSVLAATQTPGEAGKNWFQGTAGAVRQFHWLFEDQRSKDIEDVLILSGDQLYRMDYMDLVQGHIQSGADITISSLPLDDKRASDFGLMKIDNTGRVLYFSEKPKGNELKAMAVDTTVLGLSRDEAEKKPYIASMGVYVFKKEILLNLLRWRFPTANDFGSEIIPASAAEFNIKAYLFNDYWEDIGTIKSFFEANLALTEHPSKFSFYDATKPIYTSRRNLPPSKIDNSKIVDSIISHGSFLNNTFIEHSVVGIRSRINTNVHLKDTIMLGVDYYETDAEIASLLAEGRVPIGIGENSRIKGCIIVDVENFVWDPGQNVIFLYILEDKDVFERVGKDIVLMDTTLVIRRYDHERQMGCLDDIGLIPKTLLFPTAELEHYIWDPGSFVSVSQLSWEDFGRDFFFLTTLWTRWLLRGRICHDMTFYYNF